MIFILRWKPVKKAASGGAAFLMIETPRLSAGLAFGEGDESEMTGVAVASG